MWKFVQRCDTTWPFSTPRTSLPELIPALTRWPPVRLAKRDKAVVAGFARLSPACGATGPLTGGTLYPSCCTDESADAAEVISKSSTRADPAGRYPMHARIVPLNLFNDADSAQVVVVRTLHAHTGFLF